MIAFEWADIHSGTRAFFEGEPQTESIKLGISIAKAVHAVLGSAVERPNVSPQASWSSLAVTGLTPGRIVFTGDNGLLSDDERWIWSTTDRRALIDRPSIGSTSNTADTTAFVLRNATPATATSTYQDSPALELRGRTYTTYGAADRLHAWRIFAQGDYDGAYTNLGQLAIQAWHPGVNQWYTRLDIFTNDIQYGDPGYVRIFARLSVQNDLHVQNGSALYMWSASSVSLPVFVRSSAVTNAIDVKSLAASAPVRFLDSAGAFTVTIQKTMRLTNAGGNYADITAHAAQSADTPYVWPNGYPSSTKYLKSDASGNMSWDTPSGGGGGVETWSRTFAMMGA
jgi:hypothetical protein